jgi:glutathione synthase/RimK-type ligase-like ATP-grasp enzyme
MSVLILTLPGDTHAHAVQWAIEKLGGKFRTVYPFDICAGGQWSFDPNAGLLWIDGKGERQAIRPGDYSTVWMRRPPGIYPRSDITDTIQRAVAEDELRQFVIGVLRWLESDKFVINPLSSSGLASHKAFQLAAAARIGLTGPRTLISNSPSEVLSFFESCGNEFIFKPLRSALWTRSDGIKTNVLTTLITDKSILLESDLSSAPGIYQEKIVKQAEIRATFMGKSIFAWEKRFDRRSPEDLNIDWRSMHVAADHKLHNLPSDIEAKCFALMSELGLHYGAFDFAIDQEGHYHFLEVNPQGQFLWGDELGLGLNQLEAFAEFLISGDPEFVYSRSNRFTLSDYYNSGLDQKYFKEESEMHHSDLMSFNYKQVAVAL